MSLLRTKGNIAEKTIMLWRSQYHQIRLKYLEASFLDSCIEDSYIFEGLPLLWICDIEDKTDHDSNSEKENVKGFIMMGLTTVVKMFPNLSKLFKRTQINFVALYSHLSGIGMDKNLGGSASFSFRFYKKAKIVKLWKKIIFVVSIWQEAKFRKIRKKSTLRHLDFSSILRRFKLQFCRKFYL